MQLHTAHTISHLASVQHTRVVGEAAAAAGGSVVKSNSTDHHCSRQSHSVLCSGQVRYRFVVVVVVTLAACFRVRSFPHQMPVVVLPFHTDNRRRRQRIAASVRTAAETSPETTSKNGQDKGYGRQKRCP